MAHRALVEALDLHLQPVQADVLDEMALELPGRLVKTLEPRKSGWIARPPRSARLRRFARSKCIVRAPLAVDVDDNAEARVEGTNRNYAERIELRLRAQQEAEQHEREENERRV